jgi:hypothetical protein
MDDDFVGWVGFINPAAQFNQERWVEKANPAYCTSHPTGLMSEFIPVKLFPTISTLARAPGQRSATSLRRALPTSQWRATHACYQSP